MLTENELWLLSFYRASEITGSLFFGRLAGNLRPSPIQKDMTKHYADEANHAWLWTSCIESLGAQPFKLRQAYQDQYLEAAGMPANMMEVLAITQVFEQRVIGQYSVHCRVPHLRPEIKQTLFQIMDDEKWHIHWVHNALQDMEKQYGADLVEKTVQRFREADKEVYQHTLAEHAERLQEILVGVPALL